MYAQRRKATVKAFASVADPTLPYQRIRWVPYIKYRFGIIMYECMYIQED